MQWGLLLWVGLGLGRLGGGKRFETVAELHVCDASKGVGCLLTLRGVRLISCNGLFNTVFGGLFGCVGGSEGSPVQSNRPELNARLQVNQMLVALGVGSSASARDAPRWGSLGRAPGSSRCRARGIDRARGCGGNACHVPNWQSEILEGAVATKS